MKRKCLLGSQFPQQYTTLLAARIFAKKILPFGLSRAVFVANSVAMGFLIPKVAEKHMDAHNAIIAAGPLLTSIQFLLMGPARAAALSSGILVGNAYGKGDNEEVGKISRQSWILTALMSLVVIPLLLTLDKSLPLLGIENAVANQVHQYFRFYALGVWPTLTLAADQQVGMRTGHNTLPLIAATGYAGFAAAFGIPMALGYLSPSISGLSGFGLGTATASWVCLMLVRLYFKFSGHYAPYNLFSLDFRRSKKHLVALFSSGSKMAFQVLTEWLNLAAITFIFGGLSAEASLSIQPSIQWSTAFGLISLGFTQAIAGLISEYLGKAEKAISEGRERDAHIHSKNIAKVGNVGLGLSALSFAIVCGGISANVGIASQFFLGRHVASEQLEMAKSLLLINMLRTWFDTQRNSAIGTLRGFKEILYPTILSFVCMSVIGLPVGRYFLSQSDGRHAFFWLQTAMVAISFVGIAARWIKLQKKSTLQQIAISRVHANPASTQTSSFHKLCCFFRSTPKVRTAYDSIGEESSNLTVV